MLTVNLKAIQSNWHKLTSLTNASVGGVIKANAYGLGVERVAPALYFAGCREFFVASLDEALSARKYLPCDAIVYMLGGLRDVDLALLNSQKIIPVLCSRFDVESWSKFKTSSQSNLKSVIKINTGMTRLGLDEHEFLAICENFSVLHTLDPTLIMSHLACADEPLHSTNQRQLDRFSHALPRIKKTMLSLRASLANSSGIFLGTAWHFDLVRSGAALYGLNPTPARENPMQSVLGLKLPILQVRTLREVESVGYGSSATLPVGTRLAVVAGGYADGLHKTLGLQPEGYLFSQRVKVVGKISMDSMVFDISAVLASDAELMNASIEVIGDFLPIDMLLKNNPQALGYDVLTSLGGRFKRCYSESAL